MIHILIEPVQIYVDEQKPKIELIRIDLSNPEKDKSIEVQLQFCSIIDDGQGGYSVGECLETKSLVFENPDYAEWIMDSQLEDYVLSQLGYKRK